MVGLLVASMAAWMVVSKDETTAAMMVGWKAEQMVETSVVTMAAPKVV